MKKIAVALVMVGSLSVAGQASAHGNGGDVVGALIGGAVLGAVVSSALAPAPVYAQPVYAQPVYAQPVYAQPAYQQQPGYGGPPPGACYDQYQRAYVACGAPPPPPQGQYGYSGYSEPEPQQGY
ncbi:ecotin precursor [Paraburkholderia sp. BCC1886]|uniref:ecotin precursor n=1 Tax=Paraburkholderia sp. BCC1886 TaxID=2562670 RepID=UPI001182A30F|nr:ecotin precursor [Paraburkholderia sp. BCC1886]